MVGWIVVSSFVLVEGVVRVVGVSCRDVEAVFDDGLPVLSGVIDEVVDSVASSSVVFFTVLVVFGVVVTFLGAFVTFLGDSVVCDDESVVVETVIEGVCSSVDFDFVGLGTSLVVLMLVVGRTVVVTGTPEELLDFDSVVTVPASVVVVGFVVFFVLIFLVVLG